MCLAFELFFIFFHLQVAGIRIETSACAPASKMHRFTLYKQGAWLVKRTVQDEQVDRVVGDDDFGGPLGMHTRESRPSVRDSLSRFQASTARVSAAPKMARVLSTPASARSASALVCDALHRPVCGRAPLGRVVCSPPPPPTRPPPRVVHRCAGRKVVVEAATRTRLAKTRLESRLGWLEQRANEPGRTVR